MPELLETEWLEQTYLKQACGVPGLSSIKVFGCYDGEIQQQNYPYLTDGWVPVKNNCEN